MKIARIIAAAAALLMLTGCASGGSAAKGELPQAAPAAESSRIDFSLGYISVDDSTDPPEYPRSYYPLSRSIVGRINCCFDVPVGFRRVYEDEGSYMVQYADPSGQNVITVESWNGYTYDEVYSQLRHSLSGSYSEDNMMTKDEDTVGKYGYSAHSIYLINDSGDGRKNMVIWAIDKPVEEDEYVRDADGNLEYETDPETGERVKKVGSRYCFTFAVESTEENTEGMMKTAASFVTTRPDMEKEGIYLG